MARNKLGDGYGNAVALVVPLRLRLQKSAGGDAPAGAGWGPIPGGHFGGGQRRRNGRGWDYWYPSKEATQRAIEHHGTMKRWAEGEVARHTEAHRRATAKGDDAGIALAERQRKRAKGDLREHTELHRGASAALRDRSHGTAPRLTEAQQEMADQHAENQRRTAEAHARSVEGQLALRKGSAFAGDLVEIEPGSLSTFFGGVVHAARFRVGGKAFTYSHTPGKPAILTCTDTPSAVPLHSACAGWKDAMKKAKEIAADYLAGKAPRHGVYRAIEVQPERYR